MVGGMEEELEQPSKEAEPEKKSKSENLEEGKGVGPVGRVGI